MEFKFTVRKDRITRRNNDDFVEGNKGYYEAVFDFGDDMCWDKAAKLCVVECGEEVFRIPIIGGSCLLPVLSEGSFKIGVMGVDAIDGAELTTVISTNMITCGVREGAASKEANAKLNSAVEIWETYLVRMEESRRAAESAANTAIESEKNTLKAQENSENSAKNAELSEDSARQYAETSLLLKNESVRAEKSALQALEKVTGLAEATEKAKDESVLAKEGLKTAEANAKKDAADAKASADSAAQSEENAKESEKAAAENKIATEQLTNRAETAAENAEESEVKSSASQKSAEQALSDLLAMINSGDLVLAINGKLPLSAIPATATQEIYVVESEDELTSLTAQRGDLAELVEEIDGERTITKTWQCLGDASVRANWVVWGTSYAVQSGNATTADNAVNANMINNHRLVEMTEEDFASAVKDADTYYLVY